MASKKRSQKAVDKVRVWWPPTKDKERTGYSGAYWPATVLSKGENFLEVEYDNGEREKVDPDNIFPFDVPISFGEESQPLEVGEFVEVSNNSDTDPCAWVGVVDKLGKTIKVKYPFHDSPDESIKPHLLRRARIWDDLDWKFIEIGQSWKPGDVTSPLELNLLVEKDYFKLLAAGSKRKRAAAEVSAAGDAEESGQSGGLSDEAESSEEGTSGVKPKPASAKKRANPRKSSNPTRSAIDEGSTGSDAKKDAPVGAKRRKPSRVKQA